MNLSDLSAAILVGGASRRMGQDKGLLEIAGRPLIARIAANLVPHFHEVFLVTDNPEPYCFLGLPTVPDMVPGMGPLMGIASALRAAACDSLFVIACDIPDLDWPLMELLLAGPLEADCIVPILKDGMREPLFAMYRKSAMPAIERLLADGRRQVQALFPLVKTHYVPIMDARGIPNLNTPEDLQRYIAGL